MNARGVRRPAPAPAGQRGQLVYDLVDADYVDEDLIEVEPDADDEDYQNFHHHSASVGISQHPKKKRFEASQRENVLSKYYQIWNSKELSDVVITCKGGDTIQTHKFVLMVHSPVFNAMFSSGMKESKTNKIIIPDFNKHTLEVLLVFIYSGCLDIEDIPTIEATKMVLQAADKYQISELSSAIFAFLIEGLTASTVGEITLLAAEYSASNTDKSMIQKFLIDNWKELSTNEKFQEVIKKHGSTISQIAFGNFEHPE